MSREIIEDAEETLGADWKSIMQKLSTGENQSAFENGPDETTLKLKEAQDYYLDSIDKAGQRSLDQLKASEEVSRADLMPYTPIAANTLSGSQGSPREAENPPPGLLGRFLVVEIPLCTGFRGEMLCSKKHLVKAVATELSWFALRESVLYGLQAVPKGKSENLCTAVLLIRWNPISWNCCCGRLLCGSAAPAE